MSSDALERFQRLRAQFDHLRTFDDVAHWDAAATSLVAELDREASEARSQQQELTAQAEHHARLRAALPFFKRIFAGRKVEVGFRVQATQAEAMIHRLGNATNDLLECVDYTPNDEKERKALLKELRFEKKELQLRKREIAAEKREINREARNASANAGRVLFMYDAKMAAVERRAIRRDRVAQLAPFEDARVAIDRQIHDLDRRIMWVERFGTDE